MDLGDDMDLEPAAAQPAVEPAAAFVAVRLQQYWETNPEAWFNVTDGQFFVRGITSQAVRFYTAIGVIPEAVLRGLQDLLRAPPADCYDRLKARLLRRHTMSVYERMEQLYKMEPLNGQQPSALLADLLQLCPPEEAGTALFRFNFTHRLPREVRLILARDTESTLEELAEAADTLVSHGGRQPFAVAAVEEAQPIAAVSARGRGGGRDGGRGGRRGRGRHNQQQQPLPTSSQPSSQPVSLSSQQFLEYPEGNALCYYHWCYGVKATKCSSPCAWSGN
jgi:hypothetical protein